MDALERFPSGSWYFRLSTWVRATTSLVWFSGTKETSKPLIPDIMQQSTFVYLSMSPIFLWRCYWEVALSASPMIFFFHFGGPFGSNLVGSIGLIALMASEKNTLNFWQVCKTFYCFFGLLIRCVRFSCFMFKPRLLSNHSYIVPFSLCLLSAIAYASLS